MRAEITQPVESTGVGADPVDVLPAEMIPLGEQICYQLNDQDQTISEMVYALDTLGTGHSSSANRIVVEAASEHLC